MTRALLTLLLAFSLLACSDSDSNQNRNNANGVCSLGLDSIDQGDPDGHPDPLGAGFAGQARAGRLTSEAQIVQPGHGRQKARVGDFLLANSEIAVTVEDRGASDGYGLFGGEILSIDKVGEDGRPMGLSRYGETLLGLSNEMINPTSVTVLNDGADGEAAVVRVKGTFETIPFLAGEMEVLFSLDVEMPGYIDYVLAPGSSKLDIRLGLLNTGNTTIDLSSYELFGFFHFSQNQIVTARNGFDAPRGDSEWVGFVSGPWNFAFRTPGGSFTFGIEVNGMALFLGDGFQVPPCTLGEQGHAEIVAGGPFYDGLRQALRAVDGEAPWAGIEGVVQTHSGSPLAEAWVHELDADGNYLSRTRTRADGSFTIHAPPEVVTLVPQVRGYPVHPGVDVVSGATQTVLTFGPTGTLHVVVIDASTLAPIPARIQVVPTNPQPATPESYGLNDPERGRLYQHYSVTGDELLVVPPGEHRVIVSRGYEYEILDTTVQVGDGSTVAVNAALVHSVDTTDYFCADFHVHTWFSADSNNPVDQKLRSMVADGLDLPVFSDHEWVTAPQPLVVELGLENLAYGITSLELTTFSWGHFGIVPMEPRRDALNNGAPEWIDRSPGDVFAAVHALPEQPLIIVNHPRQSSIGGYLNAAKFDRETGEGNELFSDDFDAIEAFNNSDFESNRDAAVADWFAFLEHGYELIVTGSSDNHFLSSGQTGYPRSCIYFGHDDITAVTPAFLREQMLSGDVFVSGGLYINASGPGGERMGETIVTSDATVLVTVTVQAAAWISAETLEVIVNGITLETLPLVPTAAPGPGRVFVHQISIPVDVTRDRSWVVFHAKGGGDLSPLHAGRRPFAVTNAIYLMAQ